MPLLRGACDHARIVSPAHEFLRTGERVAERYNLLNPMVDRGLGEVWRARDEVDGAERIVKLISLDRARDSIAGERLARLATLNVKGVAAVLDSGRWEGWLYLAHEPCAGRSLRHWIDGWRSTQTPPIHATLKTLFLSMCSALGEVHTQGFAHERLTPRSVVIVSVKAPRPIVMFDVGVAGLLSDADEALCAPYRSPEQADRPRRGATIDPRRADLFALGVIFAEMLTMHPVPSAESSETWEQLVRRAPRSTLTSLMARSDVPNGVWSLIERLLLRRGEEMLSTPSKVRQAMREAWEAGGVRDAPPEALREAPMPVEQAPRSASLNAPPRDRERPSAEPSTSPPVAPAVRASPFIAEAFSLRAAPRPSPHVAVAASVVRSSGAPPPRVTPSTKEAARERVTFGAPDPPEDTLPDAIDLEATSEPSQPPEARSTSSIVTGSALPRSASLTLGERTLPVTETGIGVMASLEAPADPNETLPVERRHGSRLIAAESALCAMVSPSDPFASERQADHNTLSLDDAVAARDVAHLLAPSDHTWVLAPPTEADSTLAHSLRAPARTRPESSVDETLPVDQRALADAMLSPPIVPLSAQASAVESQRAPRTDPLVKTTALIGVVLVLGILVGVAITLLLSSN